MDLYSFAIAALGFVLVLTPLVFIHELGHFGVARMCGVKVEVFSIGFGREIFGWFDKHGTRWRVSWLPLGGYVKFAGDANAASQQDDEALAALSDEEKEGILHFKPLWQRAAVVAAGPFANFLLAAILFMGLFVGYGKPTPPEGVVIGQVVEGSAAEEAGLQIGDKIDRIDGTTITNFLELRDIVMVAPGKRLDMVILRDGREERLFVYPQRALAQDANGQEIEVGRIGISQAGPSYVKLGVWAAFVESWVTVWDVSGQIFYTLGDLVSFDANMDELGGPVRIAQMSGQVLEIGLVAFIGFSAMLSVNLGLINLLPIPILDGGHLLFYAWEAIFRKPPGEKVQEWGFGFGLALVMTLFVVLTFNDVGGAALVEKLRDIF